MVAELLALPAPPGLRAPVARMLLTVWRRWDDGGKGDANTTTSSSTTTWMGECHHEGL